MAVLAMLQDADVLPPEGTPEANRVIKSVIQFQSVFLKSGDPAVQAFLSHALCCTEGQRCKRSRCLDSVRQAGRRMCLRHSVNSGSPRRSISESVWRRAFANSTSVRRILIR